MAVADLIGAAVGVILLVIVAYLLVGAVISTAQIVTTAQKSATLLEEQQLKTDIAISQSPPPSAIGTLLTFNVTNNGSEVISDFAHMDILSNNGTVGYTYYTYTPVQYFDGVPGTWTITGFDQTSPIHSGELDPTETMYCTAAYAGNAPVWFQITTGNAVSASAYLP
jgi:flagellar protein FlaF